MRALVFIHRWLGVAFCLLFAMWFASGIVMHFVPFPAFTEADRFAGLAAIDPGGVQRGPAEAIAAGKIGDVTRVRLVQRSDGPIYLISDDLRTVAVRAGDLSDAGVHSEKLARAIATDYATRRRWDTSAARVAALQPYDQWTVSEQYGRYRPLYRIALNDARGTELYVSSTTGEVVLATTYRERAWNYAGSVAHWIYPTALRSHAKAWSRLLWSLSLLAFLGAVAGAIVGVARIEIRDASLSSWRSPYRGLQAWHHWLGLGCMLFVLSWIFSGWLSMDDGQLFSTGKPSASEIAAVTGAPDWNAVPQGNGRRIDLRTVEVEWFAFDGRIYRRERTAFDSQRFAIASSSAETALPDRAFLDRSEIDLVARRLAPDCAPAVMVGRGDPYAPASTMPNAPIFRVICGDDWFDIDAANGVLLDKLDSSRRAYRWLYGALHTLDFPFLTARPVLRTSLIVALCGLGLVFSLTGVVIAGRRLLSCLRPPA